MTPRRGEIWLVDFGDPIGREQAGRRPALVVSDDDLNEGPSGLVIVVPITSARRGLPSHVELDDAATGLDHPSYVKCEDLKSISDQWLIARLGRAPASAQFDVDRILRFVLSL